MNEREKEGGAPENPAATPSPALLSSRSASARRCTHTAGAQLSPDPHAIRAGASYILGGRVLPGRAVRPFSSRRCRARGFTQWSVRAAVRGSRSSEAGGRRCRAARSKSRRVEEYFVRPETRCDAGAGRERCQLHGRACGHSRSSADGEPAPREAARRSPARRSPLAPLRPAGLRPAEPLPRRDALPRNASRTAVGAPGPAPDERADGTRRTVAAPPTNATLPLPHSLPPRIPQAAIMAYRPVWLPAARSPAAASPAPPAATRDGTP